MNIRIEGDRCRTTSPYHVAVIRALNRLEGMKKWHKDRVFSFQKTPFNIEVWKTVFPNCKIEGDVYDPAPPLGEAPEAAEPSFEDARSYPTFEYKTQPRAHQAAAIKKLEPMPICGLFMDVGTGKSFVGISLVGRRYCRGQSEHLLLIAKNGVHEQWIDAAFPAHMSAKVPYAAMKFSKGTNKAKREFEMLLRFDGLKVLSINIDAISSEAVQKILFAFIASARTCEKTGLKKVTIIEDESQDIKNEDSNRTQAAFKLAHLCKYRMIMTGTPIGKDATDLYSQFKFLDERILAHRFITSFRAEYCDYEMSDYGPVLKGHKNLERLYRKIDPFIYRITLDEAYSIPEPVHARIPFVLTDEQYRICDELRDQFFSEFGGDERAIVKNAAGLLTKLQQISCGFVPLDNGELKSMDRNPRIDAMLNILDQRDEGKKTAIWCRFQEDNARVAAALPPGSFVQYYGPIASKQKALNKERFLSDPTCLYFVGSQEAAGTGLDGMQHVCDAAIFYSNSFNGLARWQTEGRLRRDGTTGIVYNFDLVARRSPDLKILANLKKKRDISELTIDSYRKLLAWENDKIDVADLETLEI